MLANDFLTTIIECKRKRLEEGRTNHSWRSSSDVRRAADEMRRLARPHRLLEALQATERINVIAEIKRASPSKGTIRDDIDPAELARAYESGGAAAISVLTEEDYFCGSLADLQLVRESAAVPILRKDFIFDEYQIYETAAAGADALLLIVAALDAEHLARLRRLTEDELGMDALVEVHTAEEMRQAEAAGGRIIGVNNRDLRTFSVSLETSIELIKQAPAGATLISESGLHTSIELRRLRALGYRGFLIGETLMRAARPAEALRQLLHEVEGAAGVAEVTGAEG